MVKHALVVMVVVVGCAKHADDCDRFADQSEPWFTSKFAAKNIPKPADWRDKFVASCRKEREIGSPDPLKDCALAAPDTTAAGQCWADIATHGARIVP